MVILIAVSAGLTQFYVRRTVIITFAEGDAIRRQRMARTELIKDLGYQTGRGWWTDLLRLSECSVAGKIGIARATGWFNIESAVKAFYCTFGLWSNHFMVTM